MPDPDRSRYPVLLLAAFLLTGAASLLGPVDAAGIPSKAVPSPCVWDVTVDPPEGPEARSWSGSVPREADGGDVDVDVRGARVNLSTWERSSWQVTIGGSPQAAARTRVTGTVDDGRLTLNVQWSVEAASVAPGAVDRPLVRVRVPDLDYDRVAVDVRTPADDVGTELAETMRPPGVLVEDVSGGNLSVAGDVVRVGVDAVEFETFDLVTGTTEAVILDSTVPRTEIAFEGAEEVCLQDHAGHRLDVDGSTGSLYLRDTALETTVVDMESGRVQAGNLALANLTVRLEYGDIEVDAAPVADGTVAMTSTNGSVALGVPEGPDRGIDATLSAPSRDRIDHNTTEAEVVDEDGGAIRLRTPGFRDRAIRTRADLSTDRDRVRLAGDPDARPVPAPSSGPGDPPAETAGLLAGLAVVVYYLWPKLELWGAGLYSRIGDDDVLDHPLRRRILETVRDDPGIHFRELKRRLDVARGTLQHHLEKLEETDHLSEARGDGYRCIFPAGSIDRRVMASAATLRTAAARQVLRAVRQAPGASLGELAEEAGLSDAVASYHLSRLADADLVDKSRQGRKLEVHLTSLGRQAAADLELGSDRDADRSGDPDAEPGAA